MEITRLGHSSFKIKGKQGVLVTDPFDPQMTGYKFPKVEADIVTISHDHPDHNKKDQVLGNPFIVAGPGEYEVNGIYIKGIGTFHDNNGGEKRGRNTVYKIEIEGINLVHLGDLGHRLTDIQKDQLGDVDVLFLPVGGTYTLSLENASEIVTQLEPKIVIPMHYQEGKLNRANFESLSGLDEFFKEIGKEKKIVPKLNISKDKLPQELEVIALE